PGGEQGRRPPGSGHRTPVDTVDERGIWHPERQQPRQYPVVEPAAGRRAARTTPCRPRQPAQRRARARGGRQRHLPQGACPAMQCLGSERQRGAVRQRSLGPAAHQGAPA
nr:hypothetical protein [Tanacetum cinerariifolium]